ncbi:MAG: hypothetical protein WDW38_004526 [Sanguina aurantia]
MSDPLVARCQASRRLLTGMTAAVSAFSLPDFHPHLLGLVDAHTSFQRSLTELSLQDVQQLWEPASPTTADSLALAAEHLLFIGAFTGCLTALLEQLHRPLWVDCGSEEDTSFRPLWAMMTDACRAFNSFPRHRPWAPPLGRAVHPDETRTLITPAWLALSNMCNCSYKGQALPASVRSLPPAFVDTLCHLACEGLVAPLPETEMADFFRQLATSIATAARSITDEPPSRALFVPRFLTPAVLETAKRGLVALLAAAAADAPPPPAPLPDTLRHLLAYSFRHHGNTGAPGCERGVCFGPGGGRGRPAPAPAMSPRVTTPEGELLRVLLHQQLPSSRMLAVGRSWGRDGGGWEAEGEVSGNICSLLQITEYSCAVVRVWVAGMEEQLRLERGWMRGLRGTEPRAEGHGQLSTAFGLQHKGVMEEVHNVLRLACLQASGQHLPDASAMARWQAHTQKLPRSPVPHSESVRRDLIKLDTWKHSGGCLSVLEASMRDAHCPNDADAFIIAAEVAVRMVNRPRHAHDPASLPPMLSLAATVRKLVGLHTGYPIVRPTAPGVVTGRLAPEVNLQLLAILMDSICHSMRAIDFAMLTEGTAAQAPRAPKTVPTGAPVTAECARQMRRVVATLLLCVLQCCGWRLRFEGGEDAAGRPLEWFTDLKAPAGGAERGGGSACTGGDDEPQARSCCRGSPRRARHRPGDDVRAAGCEFLPGGAAAGLLPPRVRQLRRAR